MFVFKQFDPSITLPAGISLHNQPDNSESLQTLSQSTSQNLSSTSLLKKKHSNESSSSSSNPCKFSRTLVNQFSSNWFDSHNSNDQNQTLKPKLLQPQLSNSQRPTSPKSNLFSAFSELRVHPPSSQSSTTMTNSNNSNMSASISLNSHTNSSTSVIRSDSELSEFVYLLDPKTLDPQHLINARLQTPIQIELLSPIQNYRRRFHEFLSMINKVMQSKCLDNSMRVALVSARNELHGQLVNLRRLLKQREAAEDGWEYVDQWTLKTFVLCYFIIFLLFVLIYWFFNLKQLNKHAKSNNKTDFCSVFQVFSLLFNQFKYKNKVKKKKAITVVNTNVVGFLCELACTKIRLKMFFMN